MNENDIGKLIVNSAYQIHRRLGPGLFEKVYEEVMEYDLKKLSLEVKRQHPVSVQYDDLMIQDAFRADLIVNNLVIVELKSVETLHDIHRKQVRNYLKLTNLKLGYLINFNETLIKEGIVRIVNGLNDSST